MSLDAFVHLCTFKLVPESPLTRMRGRKFLESTSKVHKCTKGCVGPSGIPAPVLSIFLLPIHEGGGVIVTNVLEVLSRHRQPARTGLDQASLLDPLVVNQRLYNDKRFITSVIVVKTTAMV